jgi:Domain of unknown function DUF11
MGFDVRRPLHLRRSLSIATLATSLFVGVTAMAAPAAAASSNADLSATVTNATAKPGHRVSYVIKVTNHGPATAKQVQFDFFTSRSMASPEWKNSTGRCIRSPKETACLFGTLKPGQTKEATVSGIISKKLKKGATVTNKVVLGSNTHLTNTANDTVTDNYRIGIKTAVVAPAPSPSVAPDSKLHTVTNVATDALSASSRALKWSIVALGAAAVWFAIGLTLRARKRRRSPSPDID